MASYKILFKRSVVRDLHRIQKKDVQRIIRRIEGLADDPRPVGAEKLSGEDKYRLRQGNYRILYAIDDDVITVTIVKVGHRHSSYGPAPRTSTPPPTPAQ